MIHAFITGLFNPDETDESGRGTGTWSMVLACDGVPDGIPSDKPYAVASTASGVLKCKNAGQACFAAFRAASRLASICDGGNGTVREDAMVLHCRNSDMNAVLDAALDRHETDRYDYFGDCIKIMSSRLCPWPYGQDSEDHMFEALESTVASKSESK